MKRPANHDCRRRVALCALLLWLTAPQILAQDVTAVLQQIKYHDSLLRSFLINYSHSTRYISTPSYMPHLKGMNSALLEGQMKFSDGMFMLSAKSIFSEARSGKERVHTSNESISYDNVVRVRLNQDRDEARVTRDVLGLFWNPLNAGVLISIGVEPHGAFVKLDEVENWELHGVEEVAGADCLLLSGRSERKGYVAKLWIDPKRGYRVIRYERSIPIGTEKSMQKLDGLGESFTYSAEELAEVAAGIWMPTKVRELRTGVNSEGETFTYNESEATLEIVEVNATYPDDEFRLDIPVGYRVRDDVDGYVYTQGADDAVPIPPSMAERTSMEAKIKAARAMDDAARKRKSEQTTVLITVLTVVTLAIMATVVYWRHRAASVSR